MSEKILAYLKGFKPDGVDLLLVVVIGLYLLGLLPEALNTEIVNMKNAVVALIFKNVLPQRMDDILNRLKK